MKTKAAVFITTIAFGVASIAGMTGAASAEAAHELRLAEASTARLDAGAIRYQAEAWEGVQASRESLTAASEAATAALESIGGEVMASAPSEVLTDLLADVPDALAVLALPEFVQMRDLIAELDELTIGITAAHAELSDTHEAWVAEQARLAAEEAARIAAEEAAAAEAAAAQASYSEAVSLPAASSGWTNPSTSPAPAPAPAPAPGIDVYPSAECWENCTDGGGSAFVNSYAVSTLHYDAGQVAVAGHNYRGLGNLILGKPNGTVVRIHGTSVAGTYKIVSQITVPTGGYIQPGWFPTGLALQTCNWSGGTTVLFALERI